MLVMIVGEMWRRVVFWFRRGQFNRELAEEMEQHVAMKERAQVEAGMSPEEARHAARRSFGNTLLLRERSRDAWGFGWLETLLQDIRYAFRTLRKSSGFTVIAIVTLALGIGANTAIFSAVDFILLRPLPYKDASRLVTIGFRSPAYPLLKDISFGFSPESVAMFRSRVTAIEASALYANQVRTWQIAGSPAVMDTAQVSAGFFHLIGGRPVLGRFFSAGEFQPGTGRVAVISNKLWRERFGGESDVIGRSIHSSGKEYVIIGVAPRNFHFPRGAIYYPGFPQACNIWTPLRPLSANSPGAKPEVNVLARIRRGVTMRQLQAQLAAISGPLARQEFGRSTYTGQVQWSLAATTMRDHFVRNARPVLLLLFAATGLVLLIAIANVASLQLVRGRERSGEMGIRAALGATRGRMTRQWLTESCLVSIAGGLAGLPLAIWGVSAFRLLVPTSIPGVAQLRPDWAMACFGIGISILAGVLVGMIPALHLARINPGVVLHSTAGRGEVGRGRQSVSQALVAGETALALVLLICSGLLTRSLDHLMHVRTGMRTRHLLTLNVVLPQAEFPKAAGRAAFYANALRQIRAMPGASKAELSDATLLGSDTFVEPALRAGSVQTRDWEHRDVSPGYFHALGIPLLRGRDFTSQDTLHTPRVVIVSQALARQFWGAANPVGRRLLIEINPPRTVWTVEVVGVVGDVRDNRLRPVPQPELYTSFLQIPTLSATFVVPTEGASASIGRELRARLWSINANLLVGAPRSVDSILAEKRAEPRFETWLTNAFALLGLALGLVGIYGMFSYTVERRRREIGLRIALGAEKRHVLRLVLGRGLLTLSYGLAVGIVGALAAARLMRSLLYGIGPADPATFVTVTFVFVLVSLLACYVPARRAMRVSPMEALRYE